MRNGKLLKTTILFIFAALLILLIILIISCRKITVPSTNLETTAQSSTTASEESANIETNDINQIKTIVESFGKVLVNVSLLSPTENLKNDMEKYYSPFVSQELISKWIKNPSEALGRLTSSPWPDNIEITDVKKITTGKYEISGNVVEITSVEVQKGGYADKYGVSLTLEKTDNRWLITEVIKNLQTSNKS